MTNFCNEYNSDIVCETNHTDIVSVCHRCGNSCLSDTIICSPYELRECTYRQVLGLWAIFIIILGVLGNLLTLFAIPYAARKKRYALYISYLSHRN